MSEELQESGETTVHNVEEVVIPEVEKMESSSKIKGCLRHCVSS